MAYVYIIQSKENGRYYIGSTSDIKRRFMQHCRGKHHSSKRFLSPELVFQQKFENIEEARQAERRLKSYKRRDFLEKVIKDGVFRAHSSVGQSR